MSDTTPERPPMKSRQSNLPTLFTMVASAESKVARLRAMSFEQIEAETSRAKTWGRGSNWRDLDKQHGKGRPALPICPYGCGRAGTLLEIVMGPDGRAIGIFNDHPCNCVFIADLQLGEPPAQQTVKKKLVLGPDMQYHEVEVVDESDGSEHNG